MMYLIETWQTIVMTVGFFVVCWGITKIGVELQILQKLLKDK